MLYFVSPTVLAAILAMLAAAHPGPQIPGQPAAPAPAATPPGTAERPAFLLRPSVAIDDVGIDTNILGTAVNPQRDTIGHVRLRAEPSLETGRISLNGSAAAGMSYFRQHTDQRSFDTTDTARLDLRLDRLTIYTSDAFLRTRDLFSPEIDVRLPRSEKTIEGGASLQVSGKTQVVAGVRHDRFDFAADLLSTVDLRDSLTRSEDSIAGSLRNAITPLTTLVVVGDVERETFDFSSFRNSNGVRVMGGLEMQPTALISGKAYVGYRTRSSTDGSYPDVGTLVALLDLGYHPWEPIMLGMKVERDLDDSYMAAERYYVLTGISGSLTARLGEAWELGGAVGRPHLDYGVATLPDSASIGLTALDALPWSENLVHFGGTAAYRFGRSAIFRFNADYFRRDSQQPLRNYDRLRVVSAVTIGFD